MSEESRIYLDGQLVPRKDAVVSVEDRGFNFGDGLYEVVRIAGGRPFHLEGHLERLFFGARTLEIPLPLDRDGFAKAILEVARANDLKEGTVYLQLTRGTAPRSHRIPDSASPTLVMMAKPFTASDPTRFETGVGVVTRPDLRFGYCEIKTIGLLPNLLAYNQALAQGCVEAVLVRDGCITEGCLSSAFCVHGDVVSTYPLENILPSVTRRFLIDALRAEGLEVREEALPLARWLAAEEVMMVGTTIEVLPVVRLDDQQIGTGRPGKVARLGRELYLKDLEQTRSGQD